MSASIASQHLSQGPAAASGGPPLSLSLRRAWTSRSRPGRFTRAKASTNPIRAVVDHFRGASTAPRVKWRRSACGPSRSKPTSTIPSLVAAVRQVLDVWGRIDILVNNAVDTGPGSMVPFTELTIGQLERKLFANVVAQAIVIKEVLPAMLASGGGVIVDVSSHVATGDPPAAVGSGGWGLAYAASKAAFHRFAPILAVELAGQGIRIHNVDPGYVETERQKVNAAALGLKGRYPGAPPSVPAAVIAWLATAPDAVELNGKTVQAQRFALEQRLHPDWRRS